MKNMYLFLPIFATLGVVAALLIRRSCAEPAPHLEPDRPIEKVRASATSRGPIPSPLLPTRGVIEERRNAADVVADTDPTSKRYDPIVLNRVTNMSPSDLWRKEPRDPLFAPVREDALKARIVERLRKRISYEADVNVSCHTSSCEVTVQGHDQGDDLNEALQAIDLSRLAETVEVGPMVNQDASSQQGMRIVVLYSPSLRDAVEYDRMLRQHAAQDEVSNDVRKEP
jgi:hypothetical protein